MAKNIYPITTLKPMQNFDFYLNNQQRIRTTLRPQPNSNKSQIDYVELDGHVPDLGSVRISSPGANLTVSQAGQLAFQFAQSQAQRLKTQINRAEIEGEEFLEVVDVNQITSNVLPVKVV